MKKCRWKEGLMTAGCLPYVTPILQVYKYLDGIIRQK